MNFTADIIPSTFLLSSLIIYLLPLAFALYKAPWYRLKNSADANILFASTLVVWLFWRTSVGINPGMEYHLLMITALTLMFGWAFALISVTIVQLGLILEGLGSWDGIGLTLLVNAVLPILVIHYFYNLIYRTLPHNFFIYIFVVAFFGGALTMFINRITGLAIVLLTEAYTLNQLGDDPWFMLLMLFPEAFLNGFIITILVVYRPEWISSFDDRTYLYQKNMKDD